MSEDSWFERLSHLLLREPTDRKQLIELLRDAEDREILDADALEMIEGVMQVAEMQVRDIMVPRSQMVVIDYNHKPEELLPILIESHHSRFPVTTEDKDKIAGILLAKDLLRYAFHTGDQFNMDNILRPAIYVPESKRLNVLLKEFRSKHNHMAIVADEYGGVAGLVTIEDVLEQIVGDIEDEYDFEESSPIRRINQQQYTIKGLTPIETFNKYFKANFSDDEFDTVGGIVISALGHMPRRGESVVIDRFNFKVLHADNRRLKLLRMTRIK